MWKSFENDGRQMLKKVSLEKRYKKHFVVFAPQFPQRALSGKQNSSTFKDSRKNVEKFPECLLTGRMGTDNQKNRLRFLIIVLIFSFQNSMFPQFASTICTTHLQYTARHGLK